MNAPQEKRESVFNSGLAMLERIHTLKIIIHVGRSHHNWQEVIDGLFSFRFELDPFLTEDQRKEADKFESVLTQLLRDWQERRPISVKPINHYQLFLQRLEHHYGLLMPYKQSDSNAMEL